MPKSAAHNEDNEKDPIHIAIIPDGNRRWAKEKGLPALKGHEIGIDRIKDLMDWVAETDIKYISLWGFSSENFSREEDEVTGLIKLFGFKIDEIMKRYHEDKNSARYRVKFIGRLDKFPKSLVDKMREMEQRFSSGDKQVNFLLSYGGRQEILDAANHAADDARSGKLALPITEEAFSSYLYTKGIPNPDLVIRTSGEMRLSGLMPWQTVYSELYFSNKLWPDFTKREFAKILKDYKSRKRRFGK